MELRHLRYFVAVAEELHFGRAARRLNISQPPLSQQIRALERELRVDLFVRAARRVALTHAGKAFLEQAQAVLTASDDAAEAARRAARGEVGRLTIGFIDAAAFSLLPRILLQFRRLKPGVELALRELTGTAQLDALGKGEIDVGFLRPPVALDRFEVETLVRERFVAGIPARHPLARRELLRLEHLASEPFVMYTPGRSPLYNQILSACANAGFVPRVVQHSMHIMTLIGLVRGGLGVVLLPECARVVRMQGICYRRLRYRGALAETAIAWRRGDASPIMHAFREISRNHAQIPG